MIELPDFAQPKPVSRAAALVRDREADVAAAKEAVEQAKAAIQTALIEDRTLLADALDADRDDPGTPREDEARHALIEAERRLAAEETRLTRARDALDTALSDAIENWQSKLAQEVERAEADALRLVDELRVAEDERTRRRVALSWVHNYHAGEKLPNLDFLPQTPSTILVNPTASPYEFRSLVDLLDAIREGIERASLSAEQQRAAERAEQSEEPAHLRTVA